MLQDYEFNSFDIALAGPDPLSPGVTLSGEVEGLKPPAVADKPMDPRLFVVNRSAEATEVVRMRLLLLIIICAFFKSLLDGVLNCR